MRSSSEQIFCDSNVNSERYTDNASQGCIFLEHDEGNNGQAAVGQVTRGIHLALTFYNRIV